MVQLVTNQTSMPLLEEPALEGANYCTMLVLQIFLMYTQITNQLQDIERYLKKVQDNRVLRHPRALQRNLKGPPRNSDEL